MAVTDDSLEPTIKVKRKRKRLYDPISDVNQFNQVMESQETKNQIPLKQIPKYVGAKTIVRKYTMLSASTGVIPLPVVDIFAATTVEYVMLKALCDHYEKDFSKDRVKCGISALIGGYHVGAFARSFLKLVPAVGLTISAASSIAASGVITFAIGTIFIKHFETGGTLFDFDPTKYKKEFQRTVDDNK